MLRKRIIPCLLLKDGGLVKTVKFKNPAYIGDPLNAVRILNEKEVDELIFLDISASIENRAPDYSMISDIATECFMPFCYGGGINSLTAVKKLFKIGVEKVSFNTAVIEKPGVIREAVKLFGSQAIVVSLDVKKDLFGRYRFYIKGGRVNTGIDPVKLCKNMERMGVGEIFVNNIDYDGMMDGYDLSLLKSVSETVNIPVIACGGAGKVDDFKEVFYNTGISAVSAGSLFVYHGSTRGILINYPEPKILEELTGRT